MVVSDPTDEAARLMGWHMAEVPRQGTVQDFDPDGEHFDIFWANEDGTPVINVWDFRRFPRLAEEISKKFRPGCR